MAQPAELEIPRMSEEAVCAMLLEVNALDIRDVDGGADPFHYSSGNFGPGYVDVKGTVAVQRVFKPVVGQLALKLHDEGVQFDFIAGNATGGMVPAYATREAYQEITGRDDIEYVYIRNSRKQGGQGELVTGLQHIPRELDDGSTPSFLVMEELVNFVETTTNSLLLLRSLGFTANAGAALLYYDHDAAGQKLAENDIELVSLTTLPHLLDVAAETGHYPEELVDKYRTFLADPGGWMEERGLVNQPHVKVK